MGKWLLVLVLFLSLGLGVGWSIIQQRPLPAVGLHLNGDHMNRGVGEESQANQAGTKAPDHSSTQDEATKQGDVQGNTAAQGDKANQPAKAGQQDSTASNQASQTERPWLNKTITLAANGKPTVTNPSSTLVVVNKLRNLPAGYAPPELVRPSIPFSFGDARVERALMRKVAGKPLERLLKAASADGGSSLRGVGLPVVRTAKAYL